MLIYYLLKRLVRKFYVCLGLLIYVFDLIVIRWYVFDLWWILIFFFNKWFCNIFLYLCLYNFYMLNLFVLFFNLKL